ncbi:MAG TPA: ketoacyl-ACP synthase III [Pirellulaceae bacterium]|nr:ketoacyl-ACP synthase III [Pirellulaceae bacterium]HMO93619.1 ketoacyl-ACP synthase III [Pirellulaceae bacterium]HMP70491.1 ketoacyl-ACP synthase III [Pirellulaceae bacterium]
MKYAALGPISVYLPEYSETNDDLMAEHPEWNLDAIYEKTGIWTRHIAAENETSVDMAVTVAKKLFAEHNIDPASIDYLLFCTQTPDYFLPTSACLIQDRIGLRTTTGALDFNLGCSGFVYGLSLADGLIRTGDVGRVLLITSETYSKFIDKNDRSLRTIFGDGAAATLIEPADSRSLHSFMFGTDGKGADTLLVRTGAFRPEPDAIRPRNKHRWKSALYMDGPSLIGFGITVIPEIVERILNKAQMRLEQVDYFLMHQATLKMIEQMIEHMKLPAEKVPVFLRDLGNTVSATLPFLIHHLRNEGRLTPEHRNMLIGFGVGWSWAGCVWQDILEGRCL